MFNIAGGGEKLPFVEYGFSGESVAALPTHRRLTSSVYCTFILIYIVLTKLLFVIFENSVNDVFDIAGARFCFFNSRNYKRYSDSSFPGDSLSERAWFCAILHYLLLFFKSKNVVGQINF